MCTITTVFEALVGEIDNLDIPPCAEAITEVLALRDRLDAKLTCAVGTFDAAGLWDLDAATSMTAWLRQHGAMTKREAARVTGRAKKLRGLPVSAAAWQAGELSGGQSMPWWPCSSRRWWSSSPSTRQSWCRAWWACR